MDEGLDGGLVEELQVAGRLLLTCRTMWLEQECGQGKGKNSGGGGGWDAAPVADGDGVVVPVEPMN